MRDYGNSQAGVHIGKEGHPVIRGGRKLHAGSHGLAIWGGEGMVEDCEIYDNSHAGIYIRDEGNPVLRRCAIHDGKAGGIYTENSQGTIEDCEIW